MNITPLAAKQFNALLFTKTGGWHHGSVLEGVTAIRGLAKSHHFNVDWQEDANYFTKEKLANYDVVIFLLTSGDVLNEQQQKAFEDFIKQGKGFVGVHSAADTEHDWPWFKALVGRTFIIHPTIQTANVDVVTDNFPGSAQLPERFLWTEEYYHYGDAHTKNLKYILTVDESSYEPAAAWGDLKVEGMGDFHPMAWYQEYDGGRSFYTGLGHLGEAYLEPFFLSHLYGGIYWAATGKGL
ncbi:ThuA domain-containing protein [Colwellia sp. E2M01]|nr:ThuA domain-containing protein [Colwellia sp. E2M01]MBU2872055.1 ThuA domain-containing protein [Colwellia sp. E2M01]